MMISPPLSRSSICLMVMHKVITPEYTRSETEPKGGINNDQEHFLQLDEDSDCGRAGRQPYVYENGEHDQQLVAEKDDS